MNKILHQNRNRLTAISGFLLLVGFVAGLGSYRTIEDIVFVIATILAGFPILSKALNSLKMKAFSIELLVSIAVVAALFIHEYTESAVVTFLFLFGEYLEARTLEKTRSSLKKLMDLSPIEAFVIREGNKVQISVEEVVKGDHVIIHSGGKIPVDGKIISGHAFINEAAITGESVPSSKKMMDKVFSGTIVDQGYIEVEAEKVGDDTLFARMIELIEEAQESKTKTEKFLNKFSAYYTSAIVFLSIIVLILTKEVHLAITFLVIACPGALVIGAPVSNIAGIGNGAKSGVLIKGGEVMEKFAKANILIFDKTGTLTKGKPEVTDIMTFHDYNENELLRIAAIAETISEHHLGYTIVQEAKARNLLLQAGSIEGEIIKGNGIRAKVDEHHLLIGNLRLMINEKILITKEVEEYAASREKTGNTAVLIAIDGALAGVISITDQIREDASTALQELKKNGVGKFVMLTGDNRYTAKLIADKLGMDEYMAEQLPEDKVKYVKELKEKGYVVAMAGDGINDAPAIATADIGIAMGKGGADISIETADLVLMGDQLRQLSHAYSLSKATIRNMKQNIYFAISTVFLLLLGVLLNSIHLASGMFIHEASVLLVILNAMRLIKFNRPRKFWKNNKTVLNYERLFQLGSGENGEKG